MLMLGLQYLKQNGFEPLMFFHQQLCGVTRGHDLKLLKPHAQKTVRSNFFQLELGISYQMK